MPNAPPTRSPVMPKRCAGWARRSNSWPCRPSAQRAGEVNMATYRLGVIGWPVEHSLSPAMHNAAFQALGMDNWQYELLPVPPDIVRLALREFRNHGYVGVNVTVPLKELVMPHVRPDERA